MTSPTPTPPSDLPSYALQTSHVTSTGVEILHESTGGVIVISSGRAVHFGNTSWRELITYGAARIALEDEELRPTLPADPG